jgi:hypothetical protein
VPRSEPRYGRVFVDLSRSGPMGCDGDCDMTFNPSGKPTYFTGEPGTCQRPEHRIIRPQDVAVFACAEDGTIAQLDGDLERERFFRYTQELVPCQDLGVRLLCGHGCGHALLQHESGTSTNWAHSLACTVPGCTCAGFEGSDCRCHWGNGGNHRAPYRRWCHSCKVRDRAYHTDQERPEYDDRAWSAIVAPNQPLPA